MRAAAHALETVPTGPKQPIMNELLGVVLNILYRINDHYDNQSAHHLQRAYWVHLAYELRYCGHSKPVDNPVDTENAPF